MTAFHTKPLHFILLLLLLSTSAISFSIGIEENQKYLRKEDDADEAASTAFCLERQEALLLRLETLVDSLSLTLSSLSSLLSSSCPGYLSSLASPEPQPATPARYPSVSVSKYRPLWSERFHFVAAARLDSSSPSAVALLPFHGLDGHTKYFAIGDSLGYLFLFSSSGDLLLELHALSSAPVTSILAYLSPTRRSNCILLAGHHDGSIVMHHLSESTPSSDDWPLSLSSTSSPILFFRPTDGSAVLSLLIHQSGRARYILSSNANNRIHVFTENGTLYCTAISSSRPLAFMKHRLLFLTDTGAASLNLHSMTIQETPCEGLNGSHAVAYSFDSFERSKAYGLTTNGDLVHLVLLGDAGALKCRVRSLRKSDIDDPLAIQTIKGYLLALAMDKIFVYNISSQFYGRVGVPRPLFSSTLEEIRSLFANSDLLSHSPQTVPSIGKPLIAADREKLVILATGNGYIAVFESKFPVYKVESNVVLWSIPALLFLLFLLGLWQLYMKKESVGWMADETFHPSAAPSGSLSSHTSEYRGYADTNRGGDLRSGALRAPQPRRYVSPPRYASSAATIAYRPASSESSSLRVPMELKYRGPNMEPPGFPKKRDPFVIPAPVSDDHID